MICSYLTPAIGSKGVSLTRSGVAVNNVPPWVVTKTRDGTGRDGTGRDGTGRLLKYGTTGQMCSLFPIG